jgi:16S rRNA C967 or C1407 C5-methylase (RsmB/RsmF family)
VSGRNNLTRHKTAKFEAEHQQMYDEITEKWHTLRDDTRILWDRYLQAKTSRDKLQRRTIKKEVLPYIEFCNDFVKEIDHVIRHDHSMLRKLPQANLDRICYEHHSEWYRIQDAVAILIAKAKDIHKNEMSKGW